MKSPLKAICFILLFLLLHTPAKTQQAFIDSIRTMLVDLDTQIQYKPINQLLQKAIPFCTGAVMNDSLNAYIHLFVSKKLFLRGEMLQPVSENVTIKYSPFILRIISYCTATEDTSRYQENMLWMAIACLNLLTETHSRYFDIAKSILLQFQSDKPVLTARAKLYLGDLYQAYSINDSAGLLYKLSLSLNPNSTREERVLYDSTLFALGNFYRLQNKLDSAVYFFQKQLKLLKESYEENDFEYTYWLIKNANMYTYMSKYNTALELDFKALPLIEAVCGEESNQYALCLNEIGEIYYRTGEYAKALSYAQRALEIKEKIFGNDYFDNVVNLHDMALIYTRMGLYDEAIPLLKHSLFISKKYFGEKHVYALDLESLAEVYVQLGEYDKALPLYQQALQIQEEATKNREGQSIYYPRVLHGMASLFAKLGQYDKAIDLFKQALEIKKKVFGEINPEYVRTLNSYAEVYLLKGDHAKALMLQKESIEITRKLFGETHPDMAAGYYNMATLYYNENDLKKALEFCNSTLQLQIKILGADHPAVANSYDLLGNINLQLHRNDEALNNYQAALNIRKKMMNAVHPDYIKSLYNLAVVYIKEKEFTTAASLLTTADSAALIHIENSYSSLSEDEKLIYLHNRENEFQYLPSLLYLHKTKDPAIANHIYSNAISLKSMVLFHQQQVYNSIRASNDSVNLKLYNDWRFNKAFIGKQILLPAAKRISDFDSLTDVTNQMEQQLSRMSSSFRNNSLLPVTGTEKIMQRLTQQEAMIEFIRFRLYNNGWTDSVIYAALILLPGRKNVTFVPLFEEKQLKTLLRFSNNSGEAAINYLYPAANNETETSKTLYKLIWQPLQPFLAGMHTVYYSPCGLLYKLSFAAMHAGNKKMLVDDYTLQQLLCTRNLLTASNDKRYVTTASLWGSIDYNATAINTVSSTDSFAAYEISPAFNESSSNKTYAMLWQSLPGTKTEIENIFQLFSAKNITCTLATANQASEEAFKKMDGHAPEVIHIATHGFFLRPTVAGNTTGTDTYAANSFSVQKNPMFRSGLLMAGANAAWSGNSTLINAEDGVLTAYEIAQLNLSNTQLVTLSACETALGDIEGNEGVFGLQRAFKIAGAKQILMSLWKVPDAQTDELMLLFYTSLLDGNNANTALRNAQLTLKKKFPQPYYWAGFVTTE